MVSIYEKMAIIQGNLHEHEFAKTGKGYYGKSYVELKDMIPKIYEELYKQELTMYFTFVEDAAILKIRSWKNQGEELSIRTRLPENTGRGNKNEQEEGSKMTYLKRYLLMNAFPTIISSDELSDDESSNDNNSEDVKEPVAPPLVVEAKEKLSKKGLMDDEIDEKAIRNEIKMGSKSKAERKEVLDYFKELKAYRRAQE